jgi:predicted transposase YbfD/YdcC
VAGRRRGVAGAGVGYPAFREHHRLGDLLVIARTAVLAGARSWEGSAEFGRSQETWLRSRGLRLPHGIPSHDTCNRLFADLDPAAFQAAFTSWIQGVCTTLGVRPIPVDGQTLRGSRGPEGTCLHLVRAWAAFHRLTLAQAAVAGQSNEITAIPQVLALLDLTGALVSLDALGCPKDLAAQVWQGGGDYLLALKDNQPTLSTDAQACFLRAYEADCAGVAHDLFTTEEVGHGRREERAYRVMYDPRGLRTQADGVDLRTIVQVIRTRQEGDQESTEVSYYLSSRAAAARVLAEGIRAHGSIENGPHGSLDVRFGQDRCRARHQNAAENLAWVRKVALGLFGQDPTKGSVPTRQLRAALDDDYRSHLLDLLCEESTYPLPPPPVLSQCGRSPEGDSRLCLLRF